MKHPSYQKKKTDKSQNTQSHQVSEGGKPFFKAPRPWLRWGNECGGLGLALGSNFTKNQINLN